MSTLSLLRTMQMVVEDCNRQCLMPALFRCFPEDLDFQKCLLLKQHIFFHDVEHFFSIIPVINIVISDLVFFRCQEAKTHSDRAYEQKLGFV